jgi:hypothetical protein
MKAAFSFGELPFIKTISEGVNSMVASFGTPLKEIGNAIAGIISSPTGVDTRADTVMSMVGPYYKTALSSNYDSRPAYVDIYPKVTSTYASASITTPLSGESVGVSTSIFDDLSRIDSSTLMIAGIIIIFVVVVVVVLIRRKRIGL